MSKRGQHSLNDDIPSKTSAHVSKDFGNNGNKYNSKKVYKVKIHEILVLALIVVAMIWIGQCESWRLYGKALHAHNIGILGEFPYEPLIWDCPACSESTSTKQYNNRTCKEADFAYENTSQSYLNRWSDRAKYYPNIPSESFNRKVTLKMIDDAMDWARHLVRIQITEGRLYFFWKLQWQSDEDRLDGLARQLSYLVYLAKNNLGPHETLPTVDFVVNIIDEPLVTICSDSKKTEENNQHGNMMIPPIWVGNCETEREILQLLPPIMSVVTIEKVLDVPVPFALMHENVYLDIFSQMGGELPWSSRTSKLFWRGSTTDGPYLNNFRWKSTPRSRFVAASAQSDLIDAGFTRYVQIGEDVVKEMESDKTFVKRTLVPMNYIFNTQYAADLDGNSFSERLPTLMAQGAAVFRQDTPWSLFYSDILKPWFHYVPLLRDVSDAVEKVKWAESHKNEVKRIAENGKEFVKTHLRRADVVCYWYRLLSHYEKMQDFEVTRTEGSLEIPTDGPYPENWMLEYVLNQKRERRKLSKSN